MLSLFNKFGNALPGLNHAVFCNSDFTSEKCRQDSSNAENLVLPIHRANLVQIDNMSWDTKINRTKHVGNG